MPAPLALAQVEDFEHVLWLIDNADMFGVARAARCGQAALGGIALAGHQMPDSAKQTWKEETKNFGGALLIFAYISDAARHAIESGSHLLGVLR